MTGLEFYIDAFGELDTARSIGLAVGPIPFTAIADYFRIYEISQDFDEFLYVIRRLDRAFLELNESSNTKPKEKASANSNTNKKNPNKG